VAAIDPSPDGVEFAVDNTDGKVITRREHRRSIRPAILRGIVFLIGIYIFSIVANAANGINFSTDDADDECASRRRHGSFRVLAVLRGVVLVYAVHRSTTGDVPADHINLAVKSSGADVMQGLRQRSSGAPAIAGRIVFFNQIAALLIPAEDIDLSAKLNGSDFGAGRWHGRTALPMAW